MAGAGKKKNKGEYEPLGEFNTRIKDFEYLYVRNDLLTKLL